MSALPNALRLADALDELRPRDRIIEVQAAAELRRLHSELEREMTSRQAAQAENERLKERIVRADLELRKAVFSEREACADLVASWNTAMTDKLVAAIRARGAALAEQPAQHGSLVQIRTPFCFADGDNVPVYIQSFDNNVHRFFDDGQTVLHFAGRGMKFESGHKLKFLSNIAKKHGAGVNENGVIEIFTKGSEMADAFAKYIACLVSIAHWEAEHQGLDADGSAFATEAAHGIRSGV